MMNFNLCRWLRIRRARKRIAHDYQKMTERDYRNDIKLERVIRELGRRS